MKCSACHTNDAYRDTGLCARCTRPTFDEMLAEIDSAVEYEIAEIIPIPAKCPRCKRVYLGRDAIRAPSLDNAACFYCGPNRCTRLVLHPDYPDFIDAKTRRQLRDAPLFAKPEPTP